MILAMNSVLVHLLCVILFLLPLSAVAQTETNATVGASVAVGASLSATENSSSWGSPSGVFAFGFQQLKTDKNLFLLCIWYDKIPERTIVWYANGDKLAPRGSKVDLTADHGLVLGSPEGQELWRSETIVGVVAFGVMNDNGNFMLQDKASVNLWETFKNPADTMLPSQRLGRGVALSSRLSATNPSKGRFQLELQSDGDLVLTTLNLPTDHANEPYYKSNTKGDSTSSSPGSQVVFNETGYMYILRENDERVTLTRGVTGSAGDYYHRVTLNFDGVLTQYYRQKSSNGNESWTPLWSLPNNICQASFVSTGSGTCGYNSICRLALDQRPICECPRGYSLFDPNDQYGSCKPNFALTCEEGEPGSAEELYDFEELTDVDWPTSDYALLQPFTEDLCRQSCLNDCMCAVAIFRSGNTCWKKKLPLSNGRVDPNLDGKALVKIRKGNNGPRRGPLLLPPDPMKQKKNQDNLIILVSSLLGTSVFANVLLVSAICFGFFFIYQKKFRRTPHPDSVVGTNVLCFTYQELEAATDGFKEELGRGAFGVVYKGALQVGSVVNVAVKKLHTVLQDGINKEFKTEVNVIGQTHHKNLVRLLGFCNDGLQRVLVYEYLSNGTLASFLFGDLKPSWNQRTQIALGIARGLLYLHEECSTQIIHCDIKPQNILLDEYYNARISDFGLAKLLLLDQSQTHTAIRGTKGYVAPEWFRNLPITVKVDVYSFGVLLLEIICCRRNVDMETPVTEKAILTDFAYDCFMEGALDSLVEQDAEAMDDRGKLERLVKVSIWCIQEDPSLRPTMRKVTQMLEGVAEVPAPPCPCPF